jgi:hypothetical protein
VRHKIMIDKLAWPKSAGPAGLKNDRNDRDHALTGVAIACRPFGPELKSTMALWLCPQSNLMISVPH